MNSNEKKISEIFQLIKQYFIEFSESSKTFPISTLPKLLFGDFCVYREIGSFHLSPILRWKAKKNGSEKTQTLRSHKSSGEESEL